MRLAEHCLETTADPKAVWALCTQVERWPTWIEGLEAARLEGPFAPGGILHLAWPGEARPWTLDRMDLGHGFTLSSRLPFLCLTLQFKAAPSSMGTQLRLTLDAEGLGASIASWRIGGQSQARLAASLRSLARRAATAGESRAT